MKQVALALFHGRKSPNDQLDGWGTLGPVFIVDFVHGTYRSDLKLGIANPQGDGDLKFVDDLVFYDGVYYGDWSVFPSSLLQLESDLAQRVENFDPYKARLPKGATDEPVHVNP